MAPIVGFDITGPLILYTVLRGQGASTVVSLVISGVSPAAGVLYSVVRNHRLDVIGALVLIGIAAATILGLVSGNAKLVLLEGSVPTTLFGVACLASLFTARPLIYRFAVEFIGPETPTGQEFARRWRYALFRRTFNVMTIVWGLAYIVEAAVRVVIVESESTGRTALSLSKVLPYAFAAVLIAWTVAYGRRSRRRGEAYAATAAASEP